MVGSNLRPSAVLFYFLRLPGDEENPVDEESDDEDGPGLQALYGGEIQVYLYAVFFLGEFLGFKSVLMKKNANSVGFPV